jgi:60 kDa SS-A/Ro ribonucleoprotein
MNLNSFERHGCFQDNELVKVIAKRLCNKKLVKKSKVFPYQLLMAYTAACNVPGIIQNSLQTAMEIALENVPVLKGKTYVFLDVSGSMQSPVTGYRRGSTTAVRCIDVAALFAAALLKTGKDVTVIPFDTKLHRTRLNPRDSVVTIANTLAHFGGGGTACGLPLAELNRHNERGDNIIYFSDNESWADRGYYGHGTQISHEWVIFKKRNPHAKLVLTDLQPYGTSQASSDRDILNIGGFSDQVFNVIERFVECGEVDNYWEDTVVKTIKVA